MIELKNVFFGYNKEYFALYDISLKLENGEKVALIGESGSGKTALLRVIAGLDKPQKGEVYFDDKLLNSVDFKKDVSLGYLSSKAVFYESKSVYKNLVWALKIRCVDKALWDEKVCKVLEEFEITNLKNEKVGRLCRSDRRLVQMARLALRPLDVLLCDDIEIEGDSKTCEKLFGALKKLLDGKKQDKIVVLACKNLNACKDLVSRQIKLVSGSLEVEK